MVVLCYNIYSMYSPEFWNQERNCRDQIEPAFGALATAELKTFYDAIQGTQLPHPEPQKVQEVHKHRFMNNLDLAHLQATPETLNDLFKLVQAQERIAFAAKQTSNPSPETPTPTTIFTHLTPQQNFWVRCNLFFGHNQATFNQETLTGGTTGFLYFVLDAALNTQVINNQTHAAEFRASISSPGFLQGLRAAASAKQNVWTIPDSAGLPTMFINRAQIGRAVVKAQPGPLITANGLAKETAQKIKEAKHQHNLTAKKTITNYWPDYPSSGCPVRHTQLAAKVTQQAFTEEQLQRISSVATIEPGGTLRYTWDPFAATQQLMLQQAGLA